MRRIDWSQAALEDLRAINAWLIEQATPEIAFRTLTAIRSRATFLERFPHGGRRHEGDVRVLPVLRTRYLLLYRIDDEVVQVLRVHHDRQDWSDLP